MADKDPVTLTHEEIEEIVDATVRRTLLTMGLDTSDASNVLSAQKDFAYLRALREGSKASRFAILSIFIGTSCTALGTMLWLGFKALFSQSGGPQ